jgi:large subunit ribosomal protein L17
MASALILAKRITTTVAKAKSLRKYVEPLITKAKEDTQHSRRTVMSYLQNKESVKTLFGEVAGRIGERPGGYTRIIKLGDTRLGDNAEMCLMELVDFNDIYKKGGEEKKGKTRRSRSKKKEGGEGEAPAAEKPAKAPKAKKEKASKAKS